MARFFFHYRHGSQMTFDETGIVLPSFEDAYLAAFESARDMWLELLRERSDPRRSSFEVNDEAGRLLFVLPFSEVLESCRRDTAQPSGRPPVFHAAFEAARRARRNFSELQHELRKVRQSLHEARGLIAKAERILPEAVQKANPAGAGQSEPDIADRLPKI